ncbi:radical SAM family heme chaperone HemW [Cecembia sp.]|uniref:radical SAM family heme chaperone HemW n=1 Tax=Cecembia sp. TaxID=1898110 RepID=UPI0025BFB88F|nr:radical SAM family heme chaperone HemW [Cecembia sp.]
MSGIYIHIPFCKQACHYCDFHFSTQIQNKAVMVEMILLELENRKDFLSITDPVETIYFGGGTPSLLNEKELASIINTLYKHYNLDLKEFTLEANPDDLQPNKLKNIKSLGVDRLSIGIQSFDEGVLKFYNRAHNQQESLNAIDLAKDAGFEKLSIDLIYGFPNETHSIWEKDLEQALILDPGHISSYALTIEPKTAFGNWLKKGEFNEASEDFVAEQFELLQKEMTMAGYIQYEISNFGKAGQFALHNTNYWLGVPYLGIGPSAHSFDGKKRGHNIANNALYIKSIREGKLPYQVDELSEEELVNEYILTSLRTLWGCDLDKLNMEYGVQLDQEELKKLINLKLIAIHENAVKLSDKGKLLADTVAASLFI